MSRSHKLSANQTRTAQVLVLLLLFLLFFGCARRIGVNRVNIHDRFKNISRTALTAKAPSERTMMFLRQYDLLELWAKTPHAALLEIHGMFRTQPVRKALSALMELCFIEARHSQEYSAGALKYYMSTVVYAYNYLFDERLGRPPSPYHPHTRLACEFYNRSLSAIILYARHHQIRFEKDSVIPLLSGKIQMSDRHSELKWQPSEFDQFYVAYEYEIEGLTNQHGTFGVGVPMIVQRSAPKIEGGGGGDVNMPKVLQTYGTTIFLRVESFISEEKNAEAVYLAQVELYDPKNRSHIRVGNLTVPLESDFTTPIAYMVGKSEPPKGMKGLFDVEAWADKQGLYMLQPYEAGKIPVVFVHGLMSSPVTWLRMLNNLIGDEQIRKNYQFWFFMYPTGNPVLYSAGILRDSLKTIRETYDPDGKEPAMSQMVLVGHSMGGILSRLMVQNSGDTIWKKVSSVPVRDLDLSEKNRKLIESLFFFEALPFVTRAVFIAAPHRGSDWADRGIGRIGARLVKLPVGLMTASVQALTALGEKSDQTVAILQDVENIPTGIDGLSPKNIVTQATSELPIASWVTYHSIMGNHKAGDTPGGTDLVVPYESSRLEGAASEKIVRSGHGAHNHPLSVLEVQRVLHLHLIENR